MKVDEKSVEYSKIRRASFKEEKRFEFSCFHLESRGQAGREGQSRKPRHIFRNVDWLHFTEGPASFTCRAGNPGKTDTEDHKTREKRIL